MYYNSRNCLFPLLQKERLLTLKKRIKVGMGCKYFTTFEVLALKKEKKKKKVIVHKPGVYIKKSIKH